MRNMILVTKPDRPMPRAGKGTVQKRAAIKLHEAEIDALYDAVEHVQASTLDDTAVLDGGGSNLEDDLLAIARSTGAFGDDVSLDTDLFDLGLDSLGALQLVRAAQSLSARYNLERSIAAADVYQHRNLREIAKSLKGEQGDQKPAAEVMQELYEKLTGDLTSNVRPIGYPRPSEKVVLLTGSTGGLGSYLLHELLENPDVGEIVCLGRSADAEARQRASMAEKGLSTEFDSGKVSFLHADQSEPQLGLAPEVYRGLLEKVTDIIHNAWQVNFNATLAQMEPQLYGVRRFIDFAAESRHGALIFFVSTIGAVGALRNAEHGGEVMENVVEDWNTAGGLGYGQSKLIAERMLEAAAKRARVPSAICRVGQVAGPTTAKGVWQKQEALPSLIISSKYLGCLPASMGSLGIVDWIPVDLIARSMVELCFATSLSEDRALVYHTVNPHRATWKDFVPFLEKRLQLRTVHFA